MKRLSKREQEILTLMKEGYKNREIASILSLNEKSVSTYVARAKEKLGVNNNKNVYFTIVKAIEKGLFEDQEKKTLEDYLN